MEGERSQEVTLVKILAIIAFLFSLSVFAILAHEVVIENEDWFDSKVFSFMRSYSLPPIVQFFKYLTFFGSMTFLFPAWIVLEIVLLWKHHGKEAMDCAILASTSTLLIWGLKLLFARSRPELPLYEVLNDYSFPSGHSFCSIVFTCTILQLVWKSSINLKLKWLLIVILFTVCLGIGISRIILRYHYASDVIGGFSLGIAYILFFSGVKNRFAKVRNI